MFAEISEALSNAAVVIRITQDAGIWMLPHPDVFKWYTEAKQIERELDE